MKVIIIAFLSALIGTVMTCHSASECVQEMGCVGPSVEAKCVNGKCHCEHHGKRSSRCDFDFECAGFKCPHFTHGFDPYCEPRLHSCTC